MELYTPVSSRAMGLAARAPSTRTLRKRPLLSKWRRLAGRRKGRFSDVVVKMSASMRLVVSAGGRHLESFIHAALSGQAAREQGAAGRDRHQARQRQARQAEQDGETARHGGDHALGIADIDGLGLASRLGTM